jgi:F-type H+-transporting ATPase subunit delta
MLDREVAIRYARALFVTASGKDYLSVADEQLAVLQTVFERDRALINYLAAPQIGDDKKEELIRKVFGADFARGILEFILLVARKRRVEHLPFMIEEFRDLVADERGIIKAKITTAHRLSEQQREALVSKLQSKLGKTVEFSEKLDSSVVGGVRVRLKDDVIDGTVENELRKLRERLEALEVN